MRSRLAAFARRLVHRLFVPAPRPATPRRRPAPWPEPLEERVALSGVPGAAPVACHCPFCAGGSNYTFGTQPSDGAYSAPAKWSQPGGLSSPVTITYSFSNLLDGGLGGGLSAAAIRAAIQEALGRWAAAAPLHFVEVADSGPAPSGADYSAAGRPMLRFGRLGIDGAYNTLAYAYYPGGTGLAGDVAFDTSENWAVTPGPGIDLIEVAVHEIGHALGLGHEPMPFSGGQHAIMNPYYAGRYSGPGTSFLHQDDVDGIRALYGAGAGSVTPLTGGPTLPDPSAAADLVQSYYQRVLGRTGSADEVQYYLDFHARGATWEQVASVFVNSDEANARLVDQAYLTYLGRAAEDGGRAAWARALSNGLSHEQFIVELVSSPEFSASHGTPVDYVRALYATVLGRPAASWELSAWANVLQSGWSRGQVAGAIVRSQEAYGQAVNSLFLQFLDRDAEAGGKQHAVALLASGRVRIPELAAAIITSPEYFTRNG